METADAEIMSAFLAQNGPTQTTLIAEFFTEAVLDERATNGWTEETFDVESGQQKTLRHPGTGRPIYRDTEWVEIRIPGNLKEIRRREVRPVDKQRFPREYAAFKLGQTEPMIGTPLDRLPFLSKAQVKEFQASGLRTAENVRDISDGDAQKFMGLLNLRKRINDFLEAAAGNAPLANMRSEMENRDAEIAALKAHVADLARRVAEKSK